MRNTILNKNLSSNEKILYFYLKMKSNEAMSNEIKIAQTKICEDMNISKPTAIRSLKALEKYGYIKIENTYYSNGIVALNKYTILK